MIDIDELKTNWCLANLKDIALSIQYGYNASAIEESTGVKYLRITDLQNNSVNWDTVPFCKCDIVDKYKLKKGDIVIARTGATTGKSFLLKDIPTTSVFASYLIRLETCDIYLPEYIAMYMQSKSYWQQITFVSKGTAQPGANATILSKLKIPLPPLNEQKRIVTKIEALQTRSTAVKEKLEAIKPLLDQFRQSVLAAAFRGDLTKDWREQNPDVEPASKLVKSSSDLASSNLPIGWCQALVGDVVENLKYGTSKKCNSKIDGIPVLRIPNITGGTIDHSDLKYAQLSDTELDKLRLIPGDILMIRSNGSVSLVGRTAIIEEAEKGFAYAGYLIRLRPNRSLVYPKYLNLWFSSFEIRLQIEIPLRSTSGVNNINSNETKKLRIPFTSIKEQKEIVRRIESLFKLADAIQNQQSKIRNQIETLNQSILAKAFRGELVPQDPNDEPASVLLARIKAEREKAQPKKSRSKKKSKVTKAKQLGLDL